MDPSRLISVVMPAYNVAGFVETAIHSVARQTWAAIELIVVDDGSTDDTAAVVKRLARDWSDPNRTLICLRQENRGASAARNAGLARVSGEGVAFIDADDLWYPGLLTRLAAALAAAPELDLVFPRLRYVDDGGAPIGVESRPLKSRFRSVDLLIENPIHSATGVLVRRGALDAAGRFDESLTACVDLDLWVRVGLLRPDNIGAVPEVLADYRKRAGQITGDWRRMERNWVRVRDKLAAAGRAMTAREARIARARRVLYWSTIAYNAGAFHEARRLMAEVWLRDPLFAASDRLALIRALACVASVLPRPVHDELRARFNRA